MKNQHNNSQPNGKIDFRVTVCMCLMEEIISQHPESEKGIKWLNEKGGKDFSIEFLSAVLADDEARIEQIIHQSVHYHIEHLRKSLAIMKKKYPAFGLAAQAFKRLRKIKVHPQKRTIPEKTVRHYGFVKMLGLWI